jgi:hypothetical protein
MQPVDRRSHILQNFLKNPNRVDDLFLSRCYSALNSAQISSSHIQITRIINNQKDYVVTFLG